ncbi:hypothetical protein [Halopseudomonas litoralis]|uniref:hypothetical protein n=1 Tax=Halopseudomonas litoralis TaxID=797277 RepID=UPI0012FD5592|nr:hypothetical protein [Halopseudomonas litoralis]
MPRIDADKPSTLDPDVHCCEWTLYRDRERIRREFEEALSAHRETDGPYVGGLAEALEDLADVIPDIHDNMTRQSRDDVRKILMAARAALSAHREQQGGDA